MPGAKSIRESIELVTALQGIVQANEEIAIMKMQASRERVLSNRFFMVGLSDLFLDVQGAYRKMLSTKAKYQAEQAKITSLAKNGRTVAFLLTPNHRLAGTILNEVYEKFSTYIKDKPDIDVVILGQTGKDLFEQTNAGHPYTYFDLDTGETDIRKWRPVIEKVGKYEEVQAFFGTFVNLIAQVPTQVKLTGDKIDPAKIAEAKEVKTDEKPYIFEPEITEIISFFEVQVFSLMLQVTGQEAYLAELGSRVTSMESATNRIERNLSLLKGQSRQQKRRERHRHTLTALSGMSLWHN